MKAVLREVSRTGRAGLARSSLFERLKDWGLSFELALSLSVEAAGNLPAASRLNVPFTEL